MAAHCCGLAIRSIGFTIGPIMSTRYRRLLMDCVIHTVNQSVDRNCNSVALILFTGHIISPLGRPESDRQLMTRTGQLESGDLSSPAHQNLAATLKLRSVVDFHFSGRSKLATTPALYAGKSVGWSFVSTVCNIGN